MLDLPSDLERQAWAELARFEEERNVTTKLTGFERIGRKSGMLLGIEELLKLKFGAADQGFLQQVEKAGISVTEQVLRAVGSASSLEELRRLLPASSDAPGAQGSDSD